MSTAQKTVAPVVDIPASNQPPVHARPLSPFMIGPYYRPQWTSMLSIFHRITGVIMAVGSLLLAGWLALIAAGPDAYAPFANFVAGGVGRILLWVVLAGFTFAMMYHLSNGIRHLIWDSGRALEINTAERAGKFVLGLAVVLTLLVGAWAFLVPERAVVVDGNGTETVTTTTPDGTAGQ